MLFHLLANCMMHRCDEPVNSLLITLLIKITAFDDSKVALSLSYTASSDNSAYCEIVLFSYLCQIYHKPNLFKL